MFIESLLLSAALSSPQTAYTATAPVSVASCALNFTPNIPQPFGASTPGTESLSISFVNQDSKSISSVAFNVSDGNTTSRIVDKGTFSNGVQINHEYAAPQFGADVSDVTCSIQSVAFADGSTWQAQ
jgi:hypothetical protein